MIEVRLERIRIYNNDLRNYGDAAMTFFEHTEFGMDKSKGKGIRTLFLQRLHIHGRF